MQFQISKLTIAFLASLAVGVTMVNAIPAPPADELGSVDMTAAGITAGMPAMATSGSIAASDDTASTSDASTSAFAIGIAWTGPYETGSASYIVVDALPSSCMEVNGVWDNQISSMFMVGGVYCAYYRGHGCTGGGFSVASAYSFYVHALGSYDNDISSYKCTYY